MPALRTFALVLAVSAAVPAGALAAPAPVAPVPAPPRVSGLLMPSAVTAKQGHARLLVGIRTATEARVIVRLISVKTGKVVRTTKTPGRHAPGRVWLLVEGTNSQGFQLLRGRYVAEVYAVDARKRRSNTITKRFTLTLKTPRGVFQAYMVPAWPSIIAGVATTPGGQIAAAVAPASTLAKAGLRAGDVIRVLNGIPVDSRGAWSTALRSLPAGTAVPVEFDRAGVRQTITYKAPPDWAAPSKYVPPLASAAASGTLVFKYAAIRERLDARDAKLAKTLYAGWSAAEKAGAPGEFLSGAIAAAEAAPVATAAGAYNRALALDPTMAAVQFAMGLARTAAGQNDRAITAFQAARTLDPTDAISATFHAYAFLKVDRFAEALSAADAAIAQDPRYEEARIARGVALIGLRRAPEGVAEIKRGLTLMDNAARAQQIITSSLEPNTP